MDSPGPDSILEATAGAAFTEAGSASAAGTAVADSTATEAEIAQVSAFFTEHVARLQLPQCRNGQKLVFATDVNGTLSHSDWGPLIDGFLSGLYDFGVDVKITSGQFTNDLSRYGIAKKLAGEHVDKLGPGQYCGEPWFVSKALSIRTLPGFLVDDDDSVAAFVSRAGGTGIRAAQGNSQMDIFEIWSRMTEDQKEAAVEPLKNYIQTANVPQPDSPAPVL